MIIGIALPKRSSWASIAFWLIKVSTKQLQKIFFTRIIEIFLLLKTQAPVSAAEFVEVI